MGPYFKLKHGANMRVCWCEYVSDSVHYRGKILELGTNEHLYPRARVCVSLNFLSIANKWLCNASVTRYMWIYMGGHSDSVTLLCMHFISFHSLMVQLLCEFNEYEWDRAK